MHDAHIAIVGGGLSGLYAAYRLEQQGWLDYVLLEAREVFGGRILSAGIDGKRRHDLGPTWFWPELQPELARLVGELELACFPQHEAGDMVLERSRGEAPLRTRGYVNSPASMRLAGGIEALTDALRTRLAPSRLVAGQVIRGLRARDTHVELDCEHPSGTLTTWRAGHVLLAVPPRLLEHNVAFAPALPEALARQWRGTPTWMAPHAKYVALYDRPFWREAGLSGEARSAAGPLGEIHDASVPDGGGALFGFFGIAAQVRARVPEDQLRAHCRAQLARLFGPQAGRPAADFIKDWAADPYTAGAADLDGRAAHHAAAPDAVAGAGPWAGRFTAIGSEWSPRFPGYLAGAVDAVDAGLLALSGLRPPASAAPAR